MLLFGATYFAIRHLVQGELDFVGLGLGFALETGKRAVSDVDLGFCFFFRADHFATDSPCAAVSRCRLTLEEDRRGTRPPYSRLTSHLHRQRRRCCRLRSTLT